MQNIYYTCREAYQGNFDYNRFWAEVTREREVVCAYAYATDRGDEKQAQFQNILRAIGFTVKLKPVLKRLDGTAKPTGTSASRSISTRMRNAATRSCWLPAMATSMFCWNASEQRFDTERKSTACRN